MPVRDPLDSMAPDELEALAESMATVEPARDTRGQKKKPTRQTKEDKEAAKAQEREDALFPPIEIWPEDVALEDVLDQLVEVLNQFVVLRPMQARVVALWIVHTYVMEAADFTPYLHVCSPTRECGKSTLLTLIFHLAYRTILAASVTPAALRRLADQYQPTLLMDELDALLKGDNAEMYRGALNSGFQRGSLHWMCDGDRNELRAVNLFGAKVLCGIQATTLPDTVQSRSLRISLERATPEQLRGTQRLRGHTIAGICEPLKSKIAAVATDENIRTLLEADPVVPDQLGAREGDVWRPLFAIADLAGERWSKVTREDALAIKALRIDEGDAGIQALEDIRDLFEVEQADTLFTAKIIEHLVTLENRKWSEWSRGNPIKPTGLASLLKRFGIGPKKGSIRIGGETGKGYVRSTFTEAFDRYLTPLPSARPESVTVDPSQTANPSHNPSQPCRGCGSVYLVEGQQPCFQCRKAERQKAQNVTGVTGLRDKDAA